ncbi:MAG TPA: hypothetical protein VHE53_00165 [Patescibacteria group bacterium]|nr:hypothetical protein [Patescibacteria group bacterium]
MKFSVNIPISKNYCIIHVYGFKEQEIRSIGQNYIGLTEDSIDGLYYPAIRQLELNRLEVANDLVRTREMYGLNESNIPGWEAPLTPIRAVGYYLKTQWALPLFQASTVTLDRINAKVYRNLGMGFYDMGTVAMNVGAAVYRGIENQAIEMAMLEVENLEGQTRDTRLAFSFAREHGFLEEYLPLLVPPSPTDGSDLLNARYRSIVSAEENSDAMVIGASYASKIHSRVIDIARKMFYEPPRPKFSY